MRPLRLIVIGYALPCPVSYFLSTAVAATVVLSTDGTTVSFFAATCTGTFGSIGVIFRASVMLSSPICVVSAPVGAKKCVCVGETKTDTSVVSSALEWLKA